MTTTADLKRQIRRLLHVEGTGLRLVWLDSDYEEPDGSGWEFRDPEGYYALGGNTVATLEEALDWCRFSIRWRLEHPEDYDDDPRESVAILEMLQTDPEAIWSLRLGQRATAGR